MASALREYNWHKNLNNVVSSSKTLGKTQKADKSKKKDTLENKVPKRLLRNYDKV